MPKDPGVAQDAVWLVQSNLIEAEPNIKSILRRFKLHMVQVSIDCAGGITPLLASSL